MEVINSFKKLDDDLNREIEISEFLKLPQFEGMDKATVDHLFRTIDKDGGGSVTQAELLRVMFPKANDADLKLMEELANVEQFASVKQTKNVLSRQQRDDIEKIFDMYDTDNSNSSVWSNCWTLWAKSFKVFFQHKKYLIYLIQQIWTETVT